MMREEKLPDLDWLRQYQSDRPHFGLERMKRLLSLLGNPHLRLSVIHIAGTNGKGSTIAHLRQLLQSRGLTVGSFTSPYLSSYYEQIAVSGRPIPADDFRQLLADCRDLLENRDHQAAFEGLTEFEIVTAMAYKYLAQQGVDLALIEVGMGGLLDSTNVCQPDLTAITSIGLDHTALLGDSLSAIAEQKAGIIKAGIPMVTGPLSPQLRAVISQKALVKGAPLLFCGQDYLVSRTAAAAEGERFVFSSGYRQPLSLQTPLLGRHQAYNAGLAIQLCDCYCQLRGLPLLSREELQSALEQVSWPGRLEVIQAHPTLLLDGAHNPHALAALLQAVREHYPSVGKRVLFSCIQTKSLEEMLDMLQAETDLELTLTSFEDERSFSRESMQGLAAARGVAYADWQRFLETYLGTEQDKDELVLVTGSLYFLAQVRPYLRDRKE